MVGYKSRLTITKFENKIINNSETILDNVLLY